MKLWDTLRFGYENERLKKRIRDLEKSIKLKDAIIYMKEDIISEQEKIIISMKSETTIDLIRTYDPKGTNGILFIDENEICKTIELPWRDNQFQISCIPEGKYRLFKRTSTKFGDHIYIADVQDRSAILFHPANNAAKELMGCIAPVTNTTGPGRGSHSRLAMGKLRSIVYGHIDAGKKVYLHITSTNSKNEVA